MPPLGAPPRLAPAQIAAQARARGLDPNAVLAVASREGLSGGIGDGGHAYGPFQLNNAGGVISQQYGGRVNDPAVQSWAWSPQGVDFALDRMSFAKGLKGRDAIAAIVNRFERPANPAGEIAGANAAYGALPVAAAAGGRTPAVGAVPALAAAAAQPLANVRAQLSPAAAAAIASPQDLSAFANFYSKLHQANALGSAAAAPPVHVAPHVSGLAGDRQASTSPVAPTGHGRVLGNTTGEQPNFLAALSGLAAYEHAPVEINSGYRSTQKQAQLYANRASNPNPVAPPGHSLHERGLAADGTVGGKPLGSLPAAVLRRFGLMAVPGDPVHVQILR